MQPFLVTVCNEEGVVSYFEWDVDPLTRKVAVEKEDVQHIESILSDAEGIVGHGIKFDAHALATVGVRFPWRKTRDTIVAGHLLHSGMPRNLTDMVMQYLGEDIKPLEDVLERAVKEARTLVGRDDFADRHGRWYTARKDDPKAPSVDQEVWRADYWLPREVARTLRYPEPNGGCEHKWLENVCCECRGHHWWTACSEYATADSGWTLPLWFALEREIKAKGRWGYFQAGMELPEIIATMERDGCTINLAKLDEIAAEYKAESEAAGRLCVNIARSLDYELDLPEGANNGSLRQFCFGYDDVTCPRPSPFNPEAAGCGKAFRWGSKKPPGCPKCKRTEGLLTTHHDCLNLPPVTHSDKTGEPSLDKEAFAVWELTLDERSKQGVFVSTLAGKRKRDTAISYLEAYRRFGVPQQPGWVVIHSSLNQTGTAHLRMSSNSPNLQNVGKQMQRCQACDGRGKVGGGECVACQGEGEVSFNLRRCFGPAPGREWWSFDFENIELMIPAYESGERKMIELFERPDDPPYFGSQHLLNASVIWPDLFWPIAEQKGEFKRRYASTQYQWTKNFDFALAYECGEATGDRSARKAGAWRAIKSTFTELNKLSKSYIAFANRNGYVETLPDKTIDSQHGYPIMCGRGEGGGISPTLPFCYHVSGTAMWSTRKAMVRTARALDGWNHQDRCDRRLVAQIHDELVFDFPAGGAKNLPEVNRVKQLMEESGRDIGVPLRVSVGYHPVSWAEAVKLKAEGAAT